MKRYVVGILCLSVAGCGVLGIPVPVSMPNAPPNGRPTSDVVSARAVTPRDGAGVIAVARDEQLRDRKCIYAVSLDGETVALLRNGEQVIVYADPGMRGIAISVRSDRSCKEAIAQVPVEVAAGSTTDIRVRSDVIYDLKVESTSH